MPPRDLFEEAGISPQAPSQGRDLFSEAGVKHETTGNNLWAAPDITAAVGSRMLTGIGAPLAGYAGMLGAALPGPQGQGADWTKAVQQFLQKGNWEPKTGAGESTMDALRYLPQKYSEWNKETQQANFEKNKSPLGAAVSEAVTEAAPSLLLPPVLGTGVNAVRAGSLAAKSRNAVMDATLENAKNNGMVLPPSATAGGNWLTDILESISGKAAIKQEAINRNQVDFTNKLAVGETGLPANTAMTPELLAARRKEVAQPYREAAAIDPAVADDVRALTDARKDLSDAKRAYYGPNGRKPDRVEMERLEAQVSTLETAIEDAAKNAGNPGLVQRMRDARVQLAKIHNIEDSLNRGTGDVSARVIGGEYAGGAPLTGGLETIGRTQNAYPALLGNRAGNPAPGVNNLRPMAAAALGLEGAGHGAGVVAGGLPLVGGPLRSLMLSDPMQAAFARPPLYLGSRLPQVSDPYLRAILMGTVPQDQGALYQR